MKTCLSGCFVVLLTLYGRAQSSALVVPPWCSNNAVLESLAESKGSSARRRLALLSVLSKSAADLQIVSPLWPGKRIELDQIKTTPKAGWTAWELNPKELSQKQRDRLGFGTKFEVSLSPKPRGKEAPVVLQLTNLVMGQVWLLFVNPDLDSHELPSLTPAARTQVRVLPLQGTDWSEMRGSWVSSETAERQKEPMFCGLPRSFVNELLKTGVNTEEDYPVGIILVSTRLQPPNSSKAIDLLGYGMSENKSGLTNSPVVSQAAVVAQRCVNEARARLIRANQKESTRLTELKREGQVAEIPLPSLVSWRKILEGVESDFPVRVSGVLW